jgi:hypothetical protein
LVLVSHVPTLDVEASCQAANSGSAAIAPGRDKNARLKDKRRARDQLRQQWNEFTGAERDRCVQLSHLGGMPSYIEILTCLQIARAAKKVPGDGFTTGLGP